MFKTFFDTKDINAAKILFFHKTAFFWSDKVF